jgi:glycosyltransferase involved in cell wall biosynthesis
VTAPTAIIGFGKDWHDVPTSASHVLRLLGRDFPVLWLNSIGNRRPQLGSRRDLGRLFRKGFAALRRQRFTPVQDQIRVLDPLVLPQPRSALARRLNRLALGRTVRRELRRCGAGQIELWAFMPGAADYLGCFGEHKVIYYCVDDWSEMHGMNRAWIDDAERRLLAGASAVFATSLRLVEKCRARTSAPVYHQPHGVDHAKFARALDATVPLPPDLAAIPAPRIGFYGTLTCHIDQALVTALARRRPGWSFVFVGPANHDVSTLQALPNIHLLGRREHDQLPDYCRGFAAAIIPYNMSSPFIQAVNPIKARELLAAGVPLVAVPLPELVAAPLPFTALATTVDEWLAALDAQVAGVDRAAISAAVRDADWGLSLRRLRQLVDALPPRAP